MSLKTNTIFRYRRAQIGSFQEDCDGNRLVSAYIVGRGCIRGRLQEAVSVSVSGVRPR